MPLEKKSFTKLIKRKEKQDLTANVGHNGDEDSDIALNGSSTSMKDKWISNLNYTYNICPNRKFFSSLKELKVELFIWIITHPAKLIGEVWLQMQDGTVRILTEAWYVLCMNEYLIPLEVLIGKGLQIILTISGLKTTKLL